MIIYKTTNNINGKFYVGKDERNKPDYYGSGLILKRAIDKYGIDNFTKETLEVCSTKDELSEREIHWIDKLSATTEGYNIALGGAGGDTYSMNPNLPAIVKSLTGKNNHFYGKTHTDETKDKISKSQMGRDAWNRGKTDIYSKEHLDNLSNIRKEKYSGVNHPRFIKIDEDELTKVLEENSLRKTAKHFNVSVGCITNKIKLFNL